MADALYDIAEPGESKAKEACAGRAIGIDLGTTNSLVAVVRDAQPGRACPTRTGACCCRRRCAIATDGAPIVGREALRDAAQFPHDTIVSVKRFMGRGPKDAETTRRFTPYEFASQDGPVVRFTVAGGRAR